MSAAGSQRCGALSSNHRVPGLFLPNAPYLATDMIHLRQYGDAPRAYDATLLAGAGTTGLLLGFASLYLVHAELRHRLGSHVAWKLVAAILVLASLGVYVGRVLRWNSWDLLIQPTHCIEQVLPHLTNQDALAHALLLVVLMTGALSLGYTFFYRLLKQRMPNAAQAEASQRQPGPQQALRCTGSRT